METKNITELTDIELKAIIYDEILKVNDSQLKIKLLQEELIKRNKNGVKTNA